MQYNLLELVMINTAQFFSTFPTFDLDSIVIRELRVDDKQEYFNLMTDPKVNQFLSHEDVPHSIDAAVSDLRFWRSLFELGQSIFWAIANKEDDKLIGTIGFNTWSFDSRRAEISYDLSSLYWRRGIMSLALTTILSFAFSEMMLNRIEAKTMLHNTPSIHILEKFGFQREGVLKQYRVIRGQFIDVSLYSLLRDIYNDIGTQ